MESLSFQVNLAFMSGFLDSSFKFMRRTSPRTQHHRLWEGSFIWRSLLASKPKKSEKNKTDVNALQGALEVRCRTGLPELNLSCAQSSIFFSLIFFYLHNGLCCKGGTACWPTTWWLCQVMNPSFSAQNPAQLTVTPQNLSLTITRPTAVQPLTPYGW